MFRPVGNGWGTSQSYCNDGNGWGDGWGDDGYGDGADDGYGNGYGDGYGYGYGTCSPYRGRRVE